jgi:uncharacterized protein
MDFAYTISGFVVGTIVGMTGMGGGALMTPLLVLLFGVAPATAVGTDLLYAAITKSGGAVVHARKSHVQWPIVIALSAGSLPGALATIAFLRAFPADHRTVDALLRNCLGAALLLTAAALVVSIVVRGRARDGAPRNGWRERRILPATVLVGLVLGVLVTLTSVGAGALGVTVLLFLYPSLPAARIVGTDIAHAVPLTLVAGLGHASLGTVNWGLLVALIVGSLPGIWLGSSLSARIPERVLRSGLAVLLALIGARLLF